MPAYFLDSSALLKRYLVEPGTRWVESLCAPSLGNELSAAAIGEVEVVAAIIRRSRGGGMPAAGTFRTVERFRADLRQDFDLLAVDAQLIDSAVNLARRHGLRGYDAIQLAAALVVDATAKTVGAAVTFVSSDRELNAVAALEGLTVEDPNQHP